MASNWEHGKDNSIDSSKETTINKSLNQTIQEFEDNSKVSNSALKDFHIFTEEDRELYILMSGHDFNNFVDPFGHPINKNESNVDRIECNKRVYVNISSGKNESSEQNEKENNKIPVDGRNKIKKVQLSTKKSELPRLLI